MWVGHRSILAECGHENPLFSRRAVYVLAPPQVGIDGGPADAQVPGDSGDREPLRMKRMKSYIDLAPGRVLLPPLNCIPALLPLLLTGGNTAVWRRRDGAYRGTAPVVLARLAVCSYDAS